jgi:hypothetical protein
MNAEVSRPKIDGTPSDTAIPTIINFKTLFLRLMPAKNLLCQIILKRKQDAGKNLRPVSGCPIN